MSGTITAVVVLFPVFVALSFSRAHAKRGLRPTWHQRIAFGLSVLAILFPALVVAALAKTTAPISAPEWLEAVGLSAVIGATPLAAWLVLDAALGLTRRWVAGYEVRCCKS